MPDTSKGRDARRQRIRTAIAGETLVSAAFAVAVMLLAAGAWAVWHAGERHRMTADEALRDQASYVAAMIASSVQMEGWFAVRTLLRAWDETLHEPRAWPSTDSIRRRAWAEAIGPDLPDLAVTRFFTATGGAFRTTADTLAGADRLEAAVQRTIRDSIPDGSFHMAVIAHDGDTSLVFVTATPAGAPDGRWYGFEAPIAEFRAAIVRPRIVALAYSFHHLRDSLRQQQPAVDSTPPLAISIVTRDSVSLFATPARPHPPWIGSRPIYGGLASMVTLSIEPAAVPVLMQGGYPSNPTLAIAAIFAAGVALLLLAARLARRTLALSRQRDEFTSSVSHELRTPLTNIQLFAETLLLDRARTPDEQRSALETITRETRRLVHMVENVLALSRVGRPQASLVRRPERVDQLVRDVLASFDPLLRSREISVEVALEGADVAHVDGDAVRRILVNLLDNAVRHGPEGQTLRIRVRNRGNRLELTIEDEGPGIPVTDRERIWQPFERGATAATAGTGIGLAVVHQLVTLHGGDVRIDGAARGARFVVSLSTVESGADES